MKNLIPAVLSLIDKLVPAKGYRNLIFFGLTAVAYGLGHYGVIPSDYAGPLVAGLLGLAGYFAGKHDEVK